MMAQTEQALADADAALLLIDGRAGVTPADAFFANQLRRTAGAGDPRRQQVRGRRRRGRDRREPCAGIRASRSRSRRSTARAWADLYDALSPFESAEAPDPASGDTAAPGADDVLRLAIVGRPNVGKSTLLNRLVGEARVITGAEPGLTRDSIAVRWTYEGRAVELADTAGLRRRARTTAPLDRLSARDAERALGQAAVVLVVLDATEPAGRQDMAIAARVAEEGRAHRDPAQQVGPGEAGAPPPAPPCEDRLEAALAQVKGVPVVACSALTGAGSRGDHAGGARRLRHLEPPRAHGPRSTAGWPTAVDRHPPPLAAGRRLRLRYITQVKARPPTFALFVSKPAAPCPRATAATW